MKTSEILKLARDFKLATPEQVRQAIEETHPNLKGYPSVALGTVDFHLRSQFGRHRYMCHAINALQSLDEMRKLDVRLMVYVDVCPWDVYEGRLQHDLWFTPRLWFKGLSRRVSEWGVEQRVLAQAERIKWVNGLISSHELKGD